MSQTWKRWRASPGDPAVFVEGDRGDWYEVGVAGVRVRPLFVDPAERIQSTEEGCLLPIRSSQEDEPLPSR